MKKQDLINKVMLKSIKEINCAVIYIIENIIIIPFKYVSVEL